MISNLEQGLLMLQPIFSSFIYSDKLDIDNNVLEKVCYQEEQKDSGVFASNEGGWQSKSTYSDVNANFKELISQIRIRCNQLHKDLGFTENKKQEIGNFWININRDKDSNNPHSHPGAFFSGVYYVKAAPRAGAITLMHPVASHAYAIPYGVNSHTTSYNCSNWTEESEAGKLIIFPPWVVHYVQPNRSGSDRISIAFNSYMV
jgi:uncharacterized protein (TIGR02466 family)